jgi:hypothetical protein
MAKGQVWRRVLQHRANIVSGTWMVWLGQMDVFGFKKIWHMRRMANIAQQVEMEDQSWSGGIHHNWVAPCFWLQDHLQHSELLNQTKRRNLSTNGFPRYILTFQVQKVTHHMQDDRSYAVQRHGNGSISRVEFYTLVPMSTLQA